jgi:hypothetical protein
MSLVGDVSQVGRLRALYSYVIAAEHPRYDSAQDFMCDYPMQTLAITLDVASGKVSDGQAAERGTPQPLFTREVPRTQSQVFGIFKFAADTRATPPSTSKPTIVAFDNGNAVIRMSCPKRSPNWVYAFADPTFLIGQHCIICIDPTQLGPKPKPTAMELFVNPKLKPSFVSKGGGGNKVPIGSSSGMRFYVGQPEEEHTFGDFVLFTYEAVAQSSNSGNGKTNGSAQCVIAVR